MSIQVTPERLALEEFTKSFPNELLGGLAVGNIYGVGELRPTLRIRVPAWDSDSNSQCELPIDFWTLSCVETVAPKELA
jgi:hypothetical protein